MTTTTGKMITVTGGLQGYPLQSNLIHDENSGRITGDRAVDSEYLQDFWKTFFTTGVVQIPTTALQVVAAGAMAVRINAGICLMDGTLGRAEHDAFVNLDSSDTLQDLQYRICLRRDLSLTVRQIVVAVREGRPAPIRAGDYFEIVLADVTVPRLATVLTQANITDRRNDAALCGHIRAPINNPDLTAFVRQVDAFMDEQVRAWRAMKESHKAEWHGRWTGWMGETEDVLASERNRIIRIAREMADLILAKETNTFHLINRNFDDWSVQRGCKARVEFLPNGDIRETITVTSPEMPLAERHTAFEGNEITTTITFHPWVRRLCMGCDRANGCVDEGLGDERPDEECGRDEECPGETGCGENSGKDEPDSAGCSEGEGQGSAGCGGEGPGCGEGGHDGNGGEESLDGGCGCEPCCLEEADEEELGCPKNCDPKNGCLGIWKCRNIAISTDFSITKHTTFEADGSITEVIQ